MENFKDMLDWSVDDMFSLSIKDAEEMQLIGARSMFNKLNHKIPMLTVLADRQGITEISTLNDLCPILFKHTALKSYSIDILEQGRFDLLTKWLDRLTMHDLSSFDASGCQLIDEWLLKIEQETPMRLAHSTGTSGKVSFFPRSSEDTPLLLKGFFKCLEGFGDEPQNNILNNPSAYTFVWLGWRKGNSIPRFISDEFVKLTGTEENVLALYPDSQSVDVISLNGRLRTAEASGRLKDFKISPALKEKRDELLARMERRPNDMKNFLIKLKNDYFEKRTFIMGTWLLYLEIKAVCDELGIKNLFSDKAILSGGGGSKGHALPDNYEGIVKDFFGMERLPQFYSMTELNGWTRQCPNNAYHIPPHTIPFVLDHETGVPKPRTGRQTGRYAFFDLTAQTYWGGCVTGDEVTIDWSSDCPCGRKGPHIVGKITRFSDKQKGGDDKISCAGAPKAHDDALNFLAGLDA